MPFSNFLEKEIIKGLTEQAAEVVEKAKENASWSEKIPSAISVGKAQKTSASEYEVIIKLDLNVAPHAAAFEYGSGEHGESGERYLIPGAPWLVIPRERWPKYNPPPDVDPVVLRSVMHPGVKAKPFLQPAIDESKPKFKARAAAWFKRAYLESTPRVEVISVKK
jgi:hypothetical protein